MMNTVKIQITMVISAAALAALTACGAPAPPPAPAGTRTTSAAPVTRKSPSAAVVIAARLKAAGQPVRALITYTAVSDPNHLLGRQGEYTSKVAWQDPRALGPGLSARPMTLAASRTAAASKCSRPWPMPPSASPS